MCLMELPFFVQTILFKNHSFYVQAKLGFGSHNLI
jgi:hypothetical protein